MRERGEHSERNERGRLIFLVGPSGAGKDSLLRYCRERLAGQSGFVFAHRYITRDADAGGENHVALTTEEFAARDAAGLFALRWQSHGHRYGIGIEVNQWLAKGMTVIVNGSRAYLPEARLRYAELVAVWIDAAPEVLRARLQGRGRETALQVEARLSRALTTQQAPRDGIMVTNNGDLAEAGEVLFGIITEGLTTCA